MWAHADAHALGHERGEAGVGVAQDEDGVGFLGSEELLAPGEDLPDLIGETLAAHAHEHVRLAQRELAEEHAAEPVVEVLAGVDEEVVARLVEDLDDPREADDLGPRAQKGDDLGHT